MAIDWDDLLLAYLYDEALRRHGPSRISRE
jgi:hypothetical protein